MKAYLSHFTAAYAWNIPYLDSVFGAPPGEPRVGCGRKADITFTDPAARHRLRGYNVHLCTGRHPRDAVARRNGYFTASPPLVFLELANELDIHRLILLGLQLCAYAPGRPAEAVAAKQQLLSLAARMPWHFGSVKAGKALRYVADGSGSIMESLAFMILGLPHALGGYGLGGARFNHEIPLDAEAQRRLRQQRCYVDLFFPEARLGVEYDSFSQHSTPAEQSRDLIRATTLERLGIEIVRLGTHQLYDRKACEEFAHNLAARLGKRIRIRTGKFPEAHHSLRALLPTRPNL